MTWDWKPCVPYCDWRTMLYCPILRRVECRECCLSYDDEDYQRLKEGRFDSCRVD